MDASAAGGGWQRSGIRTPDQRLRVFVSSAPGELAPERSAAREAIEQLRLAPVLPESGARPHAAQDVGRAYLEQSDVFVGIYWQHYGPVGPGMTVSGLEDELRQSAAMPRLLYVKRPAPAIEPGLRRMLDKIRAEGDVAYKAFADPEELRELLVNDLVTILTERFAPRGREGPGDLVPAAATALVGRDRDVDEVAAMLEAQDRRLVVLAGAGGIGKTRLALAVLERTRARWRDGVAFVDLSSITDPALVPAAIASALGLVTQGREQPLDTLTRRLAGRQMLIVVDNFEQVLDAAPVLADLLGRAPGLHVLVTSRVVLRVRGEQQRWVEPLEVPPAGSAPVEAAGAWPGSALAELATAPAVRLFLDRVHDVQPGFELTQENAGAVAELCRRLDGLPLALELAAAWMRVLTPEQMLKQFHQRLERRGALVDLPDRQQTLTDTIKWSYDLLPAPAQLLLTRLSVFEAPFTADAAEAVGGGAGVDAPENDAPEIDAPEIDALEGISTLLDHSMVSPARRPDDEPAFRLLDAIRQFAAERLDHPDETLGQLERYLSGVLAATSVRHGSQGWARRRLDSEQLNLQAVLRWTIRRDQSSGALLRAIGEVWVWIVVRGHLGRATGLGQLIGSVPEAGLLTESDRMAWYWLRVNVLLFRGYVAEVGEVLDQILPDARRIEEPSRTGILLMERGVARPYTRRSPARGELEEAAAILREAGDLPALGYALSHYGKFLSVDGDPGRARSIHEEMLDVARSTGDENQLAQAHYDLAMDALAGGDHTSAQPNLATAIGHYRDIDNRDGLARCLEAASALILERGDPRLAAWLIGATAAARENIGLTPWPLVAEAERRIRERVEAALPGSEFTAQLASGRTHTLEEALTSAVLALGDPPLT